MVVVVLTAGGALIALQAYNRMRTVNEGALEKALFSIKQQAGVMAAICTAVFGVISALQSARLQMGASPTRENIRFGRGARVVDMVDEVAAT